MRKYGESRTTRIMMATVPHVTSGLGLRKFQADGFLLTRVYNQMVIATQISNSADILSKQTRKECSFEGGCHTRTHTKCEGPSPTRRVGADSISEDTVLNNSH